MIEVLVVDDQPLVRAGLRALLERDGDIAVCGEASDGREGVARAAALRPDVVLMDVRMAGLDGIAATRAIVADERCRGSRVIVITTFDTDEHVFDAIDAGASGFLLKDCEPDELRAAVRTVHAGDALLSPKVTARVLARVAATGRGRIAEHVRRPLADLTDREREVLAEVATGASNAEIAERLFLSPATARTYVSRLLAKLDARDRAGLVVIAYEAGLR